MDRREIILEFIRKDQRGIEIGPYFNPLVSKATGWNVLSVDVFDAPTLREMATNDSNVPNAMMSHIEEVDLLGPAHRISELVAARGLDNFDFIVSSHNFEHLPDPIGFLHGCSEILRPGGVLSMAIPDKRACFDYFRPLSTLSGLLQAHFERRDRPTAAQRFEHLSLHSRYQTDEADLIAFSLSDDPRCIIAYQTVEEALEGWKARMTASGAPYEDCHCWALTPNLFRLFMLDLVFLRLVDFVPIKIYNTIGSEFFVHLRNVRGAATVPLGRNEYYDQREHLLHAVNSDVAVNVLRDPSGGGPATADAELQQARADLRLAERGEQEALRQLEACEALLDATYRSHSWRITKPLRALASAVRPRRI